MTAPYDYDLLVIGSGPAGHRAAIQAAKLDKRVAIVEKRTVVGGVCINTGTIPSKTLREAALRLSGYRERGFNYPTLAECYKTAAFDGINRLGLA
jgi:NAD(P) transhydrogenase